MKRSILLNPMYSRAELNGDSNYALCYALIHAMRGARPDWRFTVVFPDAKSEFRYVDDGLFGLPNVDRVPMRITPSKRKNAVSFDADYFRPLLSPGRFDAVLTNLPETAGHLRYVQTGPRRIPVVSQHCYVIHDSLPSPPDSVSNLARAQATGGALSDANVFPSDHARRMWTESAAKWLTDSQIDSTLSRSVRIYPGTLEETICPEARPVMPNPVPIVVYNHRLQAYKRWQETFNLFDALYSEGLRFKVRFTGPTAENLSAVASRPYVEVKLCATRSDYLEALRHCDLNVTNSAHETFCLSAVESMAYGQPLIAPDGVTFPEITGRHETGYPFLYSSPGEQRAMIGRLINDPGERQRWGGLLSDYVRREFASALWAGRFAAMLEGLIEGQGIPV